MNNLTRYISKLLDLISMISMGITIILIVGFVVLWDAWFLWTALRTFGCVIILSAISHIIYDERAADTEPDHSDDQS